MTGGTVPLTILGEQLLLHPGRAVIWPRRRTVIVADTHFGKSGHFGRHGIAVPAGSDAVDRERLNHLIVDTEARRLVILGDFLHTPLAADGPEADALHEWADQVSKVVELHVVAGNHDLGASRRPESVQWWDNSWDDPPFQFIHDADRASPKDGSRPFTLSGHVHPVVRLQGLMKRAMRVPVFWQRATGLILPSFGLFTGGFAVRPARGDCIYAVGSSSVVSLGSARRMAST